MSELGQELCLVRGKVIDCVTDTGRVRVRVRFGLALRARIRLACVILNDSLLVAKGLIALRRLNRLLYIVTGYKVEANDLRYCV